MFSKTFKPKKNQSLIAVDYKTAREEPVKKLKSLDTRDVENVKLDILMNFDLSKLSPSCLAIYKR
jgi:hypothetical protein